MHPALARGGVAVVTGGASGIGLAAAHRFGALGLRVCIADLGGAPLAAAEAALRAAGHIVAALLFCQEQLRVVGPAQGEFPGVAG